MTATSNSVSNAATDIRPWTARSLLFVPGDSPRKLEKALTGEADLIILDLEDSVAPSAKPGAREHVAQALGQGARSKPLWVRINPLDTPDAMQDLVAVVQHRPDGIMLPKATPDEARLLGHYLTALEAAAGLEAESIRLIVVATETAPALFRLGDYAGVPRLDALTWGAEDLAAAFGSSANRDADGNLLAPFALARTLCLAGANAAGVAPIETIDPNFRDEERMAKVPADARTLGFRGMMAIHPAQVEPINRAFTPSEDELERARRIVALFEANPDSGALQLDGEMVDIPHLKQARGLLAQARV
ncbi:MAG: CoA ester lyase [Citromicrobium sp.]|nr:CoA ester lyase [Citromicrobium sp.]MAO96577.1 CoA ester lyase [Citromicrobium sp.]MBD75716.1 CoA ester lyase [Citromicrobium sp.]MBT46460.1 CoA ester lyase [Citromicrobium sp.]|tara:strand:- start:631 stop:1542 length:912 start_codon:yes stop_codon:yes gene_type:complete